MTSPQSNNYQVARKVLLSAIEAYKAQPSVENLMAIYHAQSQVRNASGGVTGDSGKEVTSKDVKAKLAILRQPELVPGERLDYAQKLYVSVQLAMRNGNSPELANAEKILSQYIQTAWARIQDNDSQFADDYMRMTGQPPAPGQFDAAQTINGNTPTPQPEQAGPFAPVTSAPDAGARPPGVRDRTAPPKRERLNDPIRDEAKYAKGFNHDAQTGPINIEALPAYAPFDAQADYRQSGLDVSPGTGETIQQIPGMPSVSPGPGGGGASDSVQTAQANAIRMSQGGTFQAGTWSGINKGALTSGRLVFTGWQTRNRREIDPENPRFGSQIVTTRTPSYQSVAGLTYALGKPGFPTIAEYQKQMGLPVTDHLDDKTMQAWQSTIAEAAMNTASGRNMTVQDAMAWQVRRAQMQLASLRASMAAAYNVDPTASAAILGSAMKQITGRLSTSAEDSEFHRAFNSANISSQGKVDAQQFARDWVRNKYPTEAGTMAGQDFYGAMFDVLTSGPGSLGSQAADING